VAANATQILAAYGLTFADLNRHDLGFAASAAQMQDLNLDAFFVTAATPNTAVYELSRNRDLRLVPISDAAVSAIMAQYDFYVRVDVTSADYTFVTTPVQTLAVQATLVARYDLDDDVAFDIVRALIDNVAEVTAGHARGADISLEAAVQSVGVEFHPGAARFFRERGVLN
jgi:TRAP transporter TAXI family solute receptor